MRNKFPGLCFRCGDAVPAGRGHFQRLAGRWVVRCLKCVGKGNVARHREADAARRQTEPGYVRGGADD